MKIKNITALQAKEFLEDNPNAILIDVRRPDEWVEGIADLAKIGGNLLLITWPCQGEEEKKEIFLKNLQAELSRYGTHVPVLFMCKGGVRSLAAAQYYIGHDKDHKIREIFNVEDGFHGNNVGPGWKLISLSKP